MTAPHIARGDDPARLKERIALLQQHIERLADELEHARDEASAAQSELVRLREQIRSALGGAPDGSP